MKRISFLAVLALFSAAAFATHPTPTPDPVKTDISQGQGQLQGQQQGQLQAQGQNQGQQQSSVAVSGSSASSGSSSSATVSDSGNSSASSGASASNEGVSQGVEFNQEYKQVRQVATAVAGASNNTASCRYSGGLGGQGTIFGLSFNLSRKDRDCEKFELSQFLYARGQTIAGDKVFCEITAIKTILGPECIAYVNQVKLERVDSSTQQSRDAEIEKRKLLRGWPNVQK